jgi:hypothetical protein
VIRRAILASAIAMAASIVALVPSSPALALATCAKGTSCVYYFYDSPAKDPESLIGGKSWSCSGATFSWGSGSNYFTFVVSGC